MKTNNINAEDTCCMPYYDMRVALSHEVQDFEAEAYVDGKIKTIKLSDYEREWVVLFFYPGDFTFVCPTELDELSKMKEEFKSLGVNLLVVSTDSVHVHKAWIDVSPALKNFSLPMLSDHNHEISRYFDVYNELSGTAYRGTFIIDPSRVLKSIEINDDQVGRNAKELYRKAQAFKFVSENKSKVCPASWQPGDYVIEPDLSLVGKI